MTLFSMRVGQGVKSGPVIIVNVHSSSLASLSVRSISEKAEVPPRAVSTINRIEEPSAIMEGVTSGSNGR